MAATPIHIRTAKGAMNGALVTAAIAATVSILWFLRMPDLAFLAGLNGAIAGGFIGAVGGIASNLPTRGVSLLKSISVVAGMALVARAATIYSSVGFHKFGYPVTPAIVAALLGGAIVLSVGLVRSRAKAPAAENAGEHGRE